MLEKIKLSPVPLLLFQSLVMYEISFFIRPLEINAQPLYRSEDCTNGQHCQIFDAKVVLLKPLNGFVKPPTESS